LPLEYININPGSYWVGVVNQYGSAFVPLYDYVYGDVFTVTG